MFRRIKELSEDNISFLSQQGLEYSFNKAERLGALLLELLLHTGQLAKGQLYDFDFDHQFLSTEKYDTVYSYKKQRGYFPGIATIGSLTVVSTSTAAAWIVAHFPKIS